VASFTGDPAADQRDYYQILGVEKTATSIEIKKAYHRAALTSHPDKVPEANRATAEIEFKSISRAYEVLYDDQQRSIYDQVGHAAFEAGPSQGGGMGGGMSGEDLFNEMFGGLGGGVFGGMPGMSGMPGMPSRGGPRRPRKAPDQKQQYEVKLEELYKGKTVKFWNTRNRVCGTCSGSGGKDKAKPIACGTCRGTGKCSHRLSGLNLDMLTFGQ
jgi:DnaJ family protein A protein 2